MINHTRAAAAMLCAAIVLLVTACAPSAAPVNEETEVSSPPSETQVSAPTPTAETATEEAQSAPDDLQTEPGMLLTREVPMPLMTADPDAAGSVPEDLLVSLKADAANKAGVDVSAVEVMSAQAVVWNDGSLGCPRPGMMYTQALVPGYQVILKAGDSQYNYHAAQSGSFVECRPSLKAPKPSNRPGDPTQ